MNTSIVCVNVTASNTTPGFVTVTPVWSGVDRPEASGWSVPVKLAQRLQCAILAGVVCTHPKVCTDINGKTFVDHGVTVRGRAMSADLKRLGF